MNNCPKIFVTILNHNGRRTLLDCLKSVYQSDYPNFEVVVVDNDSTDGSLEEAKRNFSKAHFIKNAANLGFAAGNNPGIRFALEKFADYVLLLNNDAYLAKNTLSLLVREASELPAGIVSPLIKDSSGAVWFAGGELRWPTMKTVHLKEVTSKSPYESDYLTGCAMLIEKEVFKKIGLFDENFFLYYEDADFSYRAKRAGFSLFNIPRAEIIHDEQSNATNKNKLYWLVISGLLFFQKNAPFYWKPWLFAYLILRKTKNRYDLFFGDKLLAQEVRKAYRDFQKHCL